MPYISWLLIYIKVFASLVLITVSKCALNQFKAVLQSVIYIVGQRNKLDFKLVCAYLPRSLLSAREGLWS